MVEPDMPQTITQ